MFITKKHLSRRTILRGLGAAVSLPLLESMLPAQTPLAKTAAVIAPWTTNPLIRMPSACHIRTDRTREVMPP